jgi:predicted nucleic acid-binding Zn ribbon protein
MKCLNCCKEISNPKFCSQSCAATYNNSKRELTHHCKNCGIAIGYLHVYCSAKCKNEMKKKYQLERGLPKSHSQSVKDHRERHPERARARWIAYDAIKSGILVRGKCEVCDSSKVHAHHDDYSKPLEVQWLCSKHHSRGHIGM